MSGSETGERRWGRPCPICDRKMVSSARYHKLTLVDDIERCEHGCRLYGEHFSTGNYAVAVKADEWVKFEWFYNDTAIHKQGICDDIHQLVKSIREDRANGSD